MSVNQAHQENQSNDGLQRLNQMFHAPVVMPMVSKERFCSLTGFPDRVVDGWITRGYLPTVRIGKWSAVNLVALGKQMGEYQ